MTPHRVWNCRRSAYTLAEMLIVVTIMIMLVAAALPMAKKVMEGSQGREASRQLNAYFAMAKARALQTGRPCGIYFPFSKPLGFSDNPESVTTGTTGNIGKYWPVRHVTQVFLAEVPPHYSGGTTSAVGKIDSTTGTLKVWDRTQGQTDTTEAGYLTALLNQGEQFLVRFNYKGDWYVCNNAGSNTFNYVRPLQGTVQPYGYGNASAPGVPFQILRSPRAVGNPLELPQGTCIDITYSGVGNTEHKFPLPSGFNQLATGLAVMLSPNGAIDSMYVNGAPMVPPTGSLFFLIGKVERAGDPYDYTSATGYNPAIFANLNDSNLADPNSLWVVVSRSTGQVTTAENMPDPTYVSAGIGKYVQRARQAAIYGEQMGGR